MDRLLTLEEYRMELMIIPALQRLSEVKIYLSTKDHVRVDCYNSQ